MINFYKTVSDRLVKDQYLYEYNKEEQSLVLKAGLYGEFQRKFPLKNGEVCITLPFGEKTLRLKFQQK